VFESKKTNWVLYPLFWGSLWGVSEATLGHVLHNLRLPVLPGALMFPIGVFFMLRAFRASERVSAIFLTSLVAAGFKFWDFFLPLHTPAAVFNPALAIVSESLLVMLIVLLHRELNRFHKGWQIIER
jgi:hypothetical protein